MRRMILAVCTFAVIVTATPISAKGPTVRLVVVGGTLIAPVTIAGFIYLPGRGEDWHRLNGGTILRDGHDGKWHRASPAWSALLDKHLP